MTDATAAGLPPQVLLVSHMKALKLPTLVREYEKLAAECAAGNLDYPRYLLRLCELERIDRERRAIERRTRHATRNLFCRCLDFLSGEYWRRCVLFRPSCLEGFVVP